MKTLTKGIITLLMTTQTLTNLWASGAGTTGASILQIPVGARATAMGEAFTAQADDISSLYWNPAGLALLNQGQASFMYNQNIEGQTFQNGAVGIPLENGGIGASLSYLSYGKIDGFDDAGKATGNVSANSAVGTIGAAWLGDLWSAGLNLKGIKSTLADATATAFATDLGVNVIYPEEVFDGTIRAAATYRNLGSGLKFINQSDPLPSQWRVGLAAVEMIHKHLNLSFDYGKSKDGDGGMYAGGEYWINRFIALRAGYTGSKEEGNGLRAGLGLKIANVGFDYAYANAGDFGLTHRFELSFRFGAIRPLLTPEERKMLRRAKTAMLEQKYGEAVLLLDSLMTMEPRYKPVHRLMKTAMMSVEKQDKIASAGMNFHYKEVPSNKVPYVNQPSEMDDMESLLKVSETTTARSK